MENRIKTQRERLGWTQAELAKAVGTTSQHISRLERNVRFLDQRWLQRLSEALDVSQAELLTDTTTSRALPHDRDVIQDDVERMLITAWRELTRKEQHVVLAFFDAWSAQRPQVTKPARGRVRSSRASGH